MEKAPMKELNTFFVYGTLRPGEVRFSLIEPYLLAPPVAATLYGAHLYTTGPWPFVVNLPETTAEIVGELVGIKEEHLARILRLLDSMEGYRERDPNNSLFLRTVQPVYVPAGYPVEDGYVQAYVYTGGFSLTREAMDGGYTRITSGNWKDRVHEW